MSSHCFSVIFIMSQNKAVTLKELCISIVTGSIKHSTVALFYPKRSTNLRKQGACGKQARGEEEGLTCAIFLFRR